MSTTGTPQAAILLPSQTPPVGCQRDRLAKIGAGLLDELEQRFGFGGQRLGRAAEAAVDLDRRRRVRRRRAATRFGDQPRRRSPRSSGVARPQVDAQDGEVGHDVVRAAAVDPRRD